MRELALEDPTCKGLQLTVILRNSGQPPVQKKRKSLVIQQSVVKDDDDLMDE